MARALVLALCLGYANGFGGTSLRECPAERVAGYNVNDVVADCNELGEACDLLGGESDPGLCIQIIWADDTVDPPVFSSA